MAKKVVSDGGSRHHEKGLADPAPSKVLTAAQSPLRQKRFAHLAENAEERMTATHENLLGKGEKLRPWGENGKKLRDAQQKS